jgi:hypothetical protein
MTYKRKTELRGAIKKAFDKVQSIKLKSLDIFGTKRGEAMERFSSPKDYEEKIASGCHRAGVNVVHMSFQQLELSYNTLYGKLINEVKTTDEDEAEDLKYNPIEDMTFFDGLTDVIVKSGNIDKPDFNRNKLLSEMVQKAPPEINLPDRDFPPPDILGDVKDPRFDKN